MEFIVTRIEPSAQVVRDTFDSFVHYASDTRETNVSARCARLAPESGLYLGRPAPVIEGGSLRGPAAVPVIWD
jgi:hypothetical protein